MFSRFFHSIVLAGTLAFCIATSASTAVARTNYDGNWSVLVITQSGACDRAYRYGVQISDGNLFYEGAAPVNLQGRVARDGSVRVSVAAGEQRADGSGRLFGDHGGGSWRGQGSAGTCAGRWEAERRE